MAPAPKGLSSPLVGYSNKTVSASERLFFFPRQYMDTKVSAIGRSGTCSTSRLTSVRSNEPPSSCLKTRTLATWIRMTLRNTKPRRNTSKSNVTCIRGQGLSLLFSLRGRRHRLVQRNDSWPSIIFYPVDLVKGPRLISRIRVRPQLPFFGGDQVPCPFSTPISFHLFWVLPNLA